MTAEATPPRKGRGGRPKGDPSAVRASTIGVRVSAEEYAALRAKAEQMGFTAYGVTRDMDDPVSKALHGLLDHAVETDRRIRVLLDTLAEAGIRVDGALRSDDAFDPKGLGKMVD